jgi:hypothetical protein
MGTRRNAKKGKTVREMEIDGVRRSMTNHGLMEEDTRDRGRWRKENHSRVDKPLDDDHDYIYIKYA